MNKLLALLKELSLPFAYDHFAEGESPTPPFLCYRIPEHNHFAADGLVYHKCAIVYIELYTDKKDLILETTVEQIFDRHALYYTKSEVWIESERLYEILYTFELEV